MTSPIPTSTYRLQFHKGFTFQHALDLVPYLHDLGITWVYASPIFRATPGSLHGYDICDHNELNPEVGTREELDVLLAALKEHGMRMVLDFVPNHMGIAEEANTWWMDVLENGPASTYARYFDIDWRPVKSELENKILLPILGEHYGRELAAGKLKMEFRAGVFTLDYLGRRLPVAPCTTQSLLETAREKLKAADQPVPAEMESIILAVEHLPPGTETGSDTIARRALEVSVIKSRLAALCAAETSIQAAIEESVADIQTDLEAYDALIQAQPYRLASWRVAAEEINYRRFFDINNLAAIRMELPEVFDATHRFVFELLSGDVVAGLRIDHVDGLFDPRSYLTQLQERMAAIKQAKPEDKPLYLLVEKILAPMEILRQDWPVHGTTGYEAGAQITSVLVDADTEEVFTSAYARFIDGREAYSKLVYQSKLLVMRVSMASEVNVLGHMLNRISETNSWYRDFTLNALTAAIREVIACFPVYRTYLTPDGIVAVEDRKIINRAIALACRRNPAMERSVFEFLRDVLMPPEDNPHPVDEEARLQFTMKFQQATGPITAKGVEDTTFYIYNRFVALNEVGGEPHEFGIPLELFHDKNIARLEQVPQSMVGTSTHDTKRSEDVRARLAALSEMPKDWSRLIFRWHKSNQKYVQNLDEAKAPDANEEYLLYQILIGSWPMAPMSDEERAVYIQRIQEYMVKAMREAKVNSSWTEPHPARDEAVGSFITSILTPGPGNRFLPAFEPVAHRISELGMINSLSQTVLKLTMPGVPDIYQGQEFWDLSLVDPDNRRPVDYEARRQSLKTLQDNPPSAADLLGNWQDGRIKQLVTSRLLHLRRDWPELFQHGSYVPVRGDGEFADCCIAFRREHGGRSILVVVPRLSSRVGTPPVGDHWKDTALAEGFTTKVSAIELFTGRTLNADAGLTAMSSLLTDFPVAVYVVNKDA